MFLHLKKKSIIWLCLLVSAIVGCVNATDQTAPKNMRDFSHPNGLSVKLDEKFTAEKNDKGFVITPADDSNKNIRNRVEIEISLHEGKKFSVADSKQQKEFGDRNINYKIKKDAGGSGGEMYLFSGYEKTADGYIEYLQTIQSEVFAPDFQTIWKIIENTSLKK